MPSARLALALADPPQNPIQRRFGTCEMTVSEVLAAGLPGGVADDVFGEANRVRIGCRCVGDAIRNFNESCRPEVPQIGLRRGQDGIRES